MRWFTSDLHLGHTNITRFCNRPFLLEQTANGHTTHVPDTDAMNAAIITNINNTLKPTDELWILGDVALGNIDHTLKLVRELTTPHVTIVTGNHDRCHPCNKKKAHGWLQRYEQLTGAHIINTNTELTLTDGTNVQISHFPYTGDSHGTTDRFENYRPEDDGRWLLCGHVHTAWRQQNRAINVGIDAWAGQPVNETTITELIADGPAKRNILPWTTPTTRR